MFLLFLLFFTNSFATNLYAQTGDNTTSATTVSKGTPPFTFDYSDGTQNDCWDVNTATTWKGVDRATALTVTTNADKEALCRGLVFFNTPDTKVYTKPICTGLGSTADKPVYDPVCLYYRAAYTAKEKFAKNMLTESGYTTSGLQKFIPIRACQWVAKDWLPVAPTANASVTGVCAPRNNTPLAASYEVNPATKTIISSSDMPLFTNEKTYFADGSDVNLKKENLSELFYNEFYKAPSVDPFLSLETGITKASDILDLSKGLTYAQSTKPKYALEVENVPCKSFIKDYLLEKLGFETPDYRTKVDKRIIDIISNAKRDNAATDICNIKVLVVKKIKSDAWKTVPATAPDTEEQVELPVTSLAKEDYKKEQSYIGMVVKSSYVRFIYDDDYMSFLPVTAYTYSKADSKFTKYDIVSDIYPKAGQRTTRPCTDSKGVYPTDSSTIVAAQAILGLNPGFVEEIDQLQLLSKGHRKLIGGTLKAPESMKKITALNTYCSNDFRKLSYDTVFSTFAKTYSDAFAKAYPSSTTATADFTDLKALVSGTQFGINTTGFKGSTYYTILESILGTTTVDIPQAYKYELNSLFARHAYIPKEIGDPNFYYAQANNVGVDTSSITLYPTDSWKICGTTTCSNDTPTRNWYSRFNLIKGLYDSLVPSAYSQAGAPITSADNVYYFISNKNSSATDYLQSSTVGASSYSYLYWLNQMTGAGNSSSTLNPDATTIPTATTKTGKGLNLSGDTLGKLGLAALTAIMTDQTNKIDQKRIMSAANLEAIKARMNQCSSMDCSVNKDLCLSQMVKCRADFKILGIKLGRKDDMCMRKDMSADSDEYKYCDTVCPAAYSTLSVYRNPFSGETKNMTAYEICLANVTNCLVGDRCTNKCYTYIEANMKTPGMFSDQQIKNCFLGITPTAATNTMQYGIPQNLATKNTPDLTKKAAAPATSPAGGGAVGGAAAANSPGAGVKDVEKQRPDYSNYGRYNASGDAPSRFSTGANPNNFGGSYNAGGDATTPTGTGLVAPKAGPSELGIKTMWERQKNFTPDKLKTN